jgi:hypothetical protein
LLFNFQPSGIAVARRSLSDCVEIASISAKLILSLGNAKRRLLMRFLKICTAVLILWLCAILIACGGNKDEVKSEPTTISTTLGQELLDLKKAYEDGIITEKEYEKAKKALIEKRTN